jgi:hypothetical protein
MIDIIALKKSLRSVKFDNLGVKRVKFGTIVNNQKIKIEMDCEYKEKVLDLDKIFESQELLCKFHCDFEPSEEDENKVLLIQHHRI